jgi:uncharacterized membrane protein
MGALARFVRTTVVGGMLFLVPVVVLSVVLGHGLRVARHLVAPLASRLPLERVAGVAVASLLEILLVVFVCFLAGLAARSPGARRLVHGAEERLLWRVPGYAKLNVLSADLSARVGESSRDARDPGAHLLPVLVRLDDCEQIGLELERALDGRVVVYLPGAPDAWSGSILVVESGRISPLPTGLRDVVQVHQRLGRGVRDLLAARAP